MGVASCHPNRIAKVKDLCGSCYDKHLKQVNPEYRKRQINNTSEWMKRNPEKRKAMNQARRVRELSDPLRYIKKRNSMLKNKYGISLEIYNEMLKNQNGSCALCFRKPSSTPLHVDHSHETNKVRGLLCHQCNWYLGTIESDPKILSRIERYLECNYELRQG